MRRFSTAVTITDPWVKYQTLVGAGRYAPDPAQHRLARHLRDVYLRLRDYSPQVEYRQRLDEIARLTERRPPDDDGTARGILALRHHAIWRNPLFKHLLPAAEQRDSLALTRVLRGRDMAMEMDSPKGLFLSGEVGTGKSMLLDLLADGLPTRRKRRWHFGTFMLYLLSQLEKHREAHAAAAASAEYSMAWMAKRLVDESAILFLDEFQLPDRAASKMLSHLLTAFFQLGGVLVASSNRMPEELQRAAGVDYAPGPARGLMGKVLGARAQGELYGPSSDFAGFLDVLKARCDFWHMEGARDWRRREQSDSPEAPASGGATDPAGPVAGGGLVSDAAASEQRRPHHYYICGQDDDLWDGRIRGLTGWTGAAPIPWRPSTCVVYGREVVTPQHHNGHALWDFGRLVESFGPADYISLASACHTFIIDAVPTLTTLQKNEARRFITLVDALYEARCKLVVRAEGPPDDLFFPGRARSEPGDAEGPGDLTYSETVAEVYQDQMSPFRPNVSFYDSKSATSKYDPDQDSDARPQRRSVDFGKTGAFTGEDERFAYKRATSRLWELCSAAWHARTGDWWQPLPAEARHWEGGAVAARPRDRAAPSPGDTDEGMGESTDVDGPAGLSRWAVEALRKRGEST